MRTRDALLAAAGALALAGAAPAHPYHVAHAEAEYDAEAHRLQVAMRVYPEDLERALERRFEREVDLEKTEDVDDLIRSYLDETFQTRPEGERTPDDHETDEVRWVGKELEVRHAWLYFELSLPEGRSLEELELSSRIMLKVERSQDNTVRVRRGNTQAADLRFDRERLWAPIDFDPDSR